MNLSSYLKILVVLCDVHVHAMVLMCVSVGDDGVHIWMCCVQGCHIYGFPRRSTDFLTRSSGLPVFSYNYRKSTGFCLTFLHRIFNTFYNTLHNQIW